MNLTDEQIAFMKLPQQRGYIKTLGPELLEAYDEAAKAGDLEYCSLFGDGTVGGWKKVNALWRDSSKETDYNALFRLRHDFKRPEPHWSERVYNNELRDMKTPIQRGYAVLLGKGDVYEAAAKAGDLQYKEINQKVWKKVNLIWSCSEQKYDREIVFRLRPDFERPGR